MESTGSFSPLIEVYAYSKVEIECEPFSNCSGVRLKCGIGNPSSEGRLKCGMEKRGNSWGCVGKCSNFTANSGDVNHSYTLFPNNLDATLSDVVYSFSTGQNCSDATCKGMGIDCSSIFGREVQHCTILCDTSRSCEGAAINCPRHTKGSGSCTVICAKDASCKGMVLSGRSVANVIIKCESVFTCQQSQIHHFQPSARLLQVDAYGLGSGNNMEIRYGGSDDSETIVRCSLWTNQEPVSGHICNSIIVDDSWGKDPIGGGTFTLDCRGLDSMDISMSDEELRERSCRILAAMQRTREVYFLFSDSFFPTDDELASIQISSAQFVKAVNPGNIQMEIEANSVNISLSHGFNEIKMHRALKQLFVEGDFYEDTYEFIWSEETSTMEANGPAQFIFTSDVAEKDAAAYWTYGTSFPQNKQGATIKLPGNPGDYNMSRLFLLDTFSAKRAPPPFNLREATFGVHDVWQKRYTLKTIRDIFPSIFSP